MPRSPVMEAARAGDLTRGCWRQIPPPLDEVVAQGTMELTQATDAARQPAPALARRIVAEYMEKQAAAAPFEPGGAHAARSRGAPARTPPAKLPPARRQGRTSIQRCWTQFKHCGPRFECVGLSLSTADLNSSTANLDSSVPDSIQSGAEEFSMVA
ncbi:hypothetical protein C2845_PM02G02530 [Panicum miliaceum]|uniref:Uncharacterized protein n=1 Tax=Panicum miliaceum TaxID=4540 RepID=A0A3L6SAZ7_PANMI|nr:hypothetical protein C2845_PM02G02530 [Panicum miliaceum]